MMTDLQALIIAFVQGVSELFPISSLGHAVLLPAILRWQIDQHSPDFLPFLVALHLGTAAALLIYFWRDWLSFATAVIRADTAQARIERRTFVLVCVATLPAVILGFGLRHEIEHLFGSPMVAAVFLVVNGGVLFIAEKIRHAGHRTIDRLTFGAALVIGAAQALALIPGISRSGATMVGGVVAGLTHDDAARFSFLLATPIILGAGVLEIPKLLHSHGDALVQSVTGGVLAGVVAYASISILMYYFRKSELDSLRPFAWYCIAAGAVSALLLLI